MRISGVYQIQSIIKPQRIYIGSAISIYKRWREHLSDLKLNKHHSPQLQRHFNKYGEADLQFSILSGCDQNDLLKIEQYFIDSHNPFFNTCKVAGSTLGNHWIMSQKGKQNISNAHKGKKHSEQHRKNISKALKGRVFSEEQRNNMGKSKIGKKYWLGKHQSDEAKEKVRKARIAYWMNKKLA